MRIISFLLLPLLFATCKPEQKEPKDLGFFPLSEEERSYLVFKPGSWWIYKNTHYGVYDTVRITYMSIDTFHEEGMSYKMSYENLFYNTKNSHRNSIYSCGQYPGKNLDLRPYKHVFILDVTRHDPFGGPNTYFYYPFSYERLGFPSIICLGVIADTMINSTQYHNVVRFYIDDNYIFNSGSGEWSSTGKGIIYWAKNVGLIKISNRSLDPDQQWINEAWELTEYHIEP